MSFTGNLIEMSHAVFQCPSTEIKVVSSVWL